MREMPKKNYIYLLLIVGATIIISIMLSRFYNNRHRETSILYNYLSEVTIEDLDAYLTERDTTILYIDDKYNLDDNKEEEKLKEKIIVNNMNNSFVFLDSNNIDSKFVESFNKKYHYNFKDDYPMIIVMNQDGVLKTYSKLDVNKFDFEELK